MHSVLETPFFSRRADALLSREDRDRLVSALAADPLAGEPIPGMGGIRKLRFAPEGRGKSGGFRVVYWLGPDTLPVLALLLYGKNEQSDVSPAQRKAILALVKELTR